MSRRGRKWSAFRPSITGSHAPILITLVREGRQGQQNWPGDKSLSEESNHSEQKNVSWVARACRRWRSLQTGLSSWDGKAEWSGAPLCSWTTCFSANQGQQLRQDSLSRICKVGVTGCTSSVAVRIKWVNQYRQNRIIESAQSTPPGVWEDGSLSWLQSGSLGVGPNLLFIGHPAVRDFHPKTQNVRTCPSSPSQEEAEEKVTCMSFSFTLFSLCYLPFPLPGTGTASFSTGKLKCPRENKSTEQGSENLYCCPKENDRRNWEW